MGQGGGGGAIDLSDDDSDVYNSSMDRGMRRNGGGGGGGRDDSAGRGGERLVKPSQIKRNKKQGKQKQQQFNSPFILTLLHFETSHILPVRML